MFCSHCGKELSDDAFMCPNCGSPIRKTAQKKSIPQEGGKETGLAIAGFIPAMIAFVTGIIFGAFFYVYPGSALLLYTVGASTILPALAAISMNAYTLVRIRGKENALAKNLSITAIVLAGVALLFLFLTGCILAATIGY